MKRIIIFLLMLVVLCSFTYGGVVDGQVSYFKLDVNSATQEDSAGTDNLTVTTATYTANGEINGAYECNGVDSILRKTAPTNFDESQFTFDGWINFSGTPTEFIASTVYTTGNFYGWTFMVFTGNTLRAQLFTGSGSSNFDVRSSTTFSSNVWQYVAITYDGTNVKLYIEGTEVAYSAHPTGTMAVSAGNHVIDICDRFPNIAPFTGGIDEIGYWNRALNSTEILERFNSGLQYPYTAPGLDNNLTITLNQPTNETIFYGDYDGIISVDLTNVNGTAECDINNTNWIENSSTYGNETVYFINTNVTGNNQSIIVNCSDLDNEASIEFWFYQENVINLTFYNEETLQIMNGTNISIDFVSSEGTSNASTITGVYSTTYFPLGDVEIQFTAPGYVIRQNYFTLFPGQQYSIDLYLINESKATQVLFEIKDEFGDPVEGFRIKTMRRISGIYYLIETSKTNWQGLADFYGLLSTPMYYWIIVDDYDNVYRQTGESEIYATTLPFSVVLTEPIGHLYQTHGDLIYTLTFDNVTNKFTYNYIDTSNSCTEARITVRKFPSNTLVSTNYSTETTGILTIDLDSIYENGSTYMATVTMNYSPSTYIDSKSYSYPIVPFVMGNYGIFLTVFIVIIIAFSGLWNPAVMFILEGIAFFITRSVNLHHLSYTATISIVIICLISAYLVSDRT